MNTHDLSKLLEPRLKVFLSGVLAIAFDVYLWVTRSCRHPVEIIMNLCHNMKIFSSVVVPNIYEDKRDGPLKMETVRWKTFNDKERYLPLIRNITYSSKEFMAKLYVFKLHE